MQACLFPLHPTPRGAPSTGPKSAHIFHHQPPLPCSSGLLRRTRVVLCPYFRVGLERLRWVFGCLSISRYLWLQSHCTANPIRRQHQPRREPGLLSRHCPAGGASAPRRSAASCPLDRCGRRTDLYCERSRSAGSETLAASRSLGCSERVRNATEISVPTQRATPPPVLMEGYVRKRVGVLFSNWAAQTCF